MRTCAVDVCLVCAWWRGVKPGHPQGEAVPRWPPPHGPPHSPTTQPEHYKGITRVYARGMRERRCVVGVARHKSQHRNRLAHASKTVWKLSASWPSLCRSSPATRVGGVVPQVVYIVAQKVRAGPRVNHAPYVHPGTLDTALLLTMQCGAPAARVGGRARKTASSRGLGLAAASCAVSTTGPILPMTFCPRAAMSLGSGL